MFDSFDRLNQIAEKESVSISRYWNHPKITITVNRERIQILCPLPDFVDALIAEIGDPMELLLTEKPAMLTFMDRVRQRWSPPGLNQESLSKRIRLAAARVVEKIKEAS